MKIALRKPLIVGEKSIDEIDLKLDEMTGADFLFCSREAQRKSGMPIIYFELDDTFRLEVMAKASGIASEALTKLGLQDYAEADRKIRNFLTGSDSD